MKYFASFFLIIAYFFANSCNQNKKDINNKILKVMDNFTSFRKGEMDTCWLTTNNNNSLFYDTCLLIQKSQNGLNNFLLFATKRYNQKDDYSEVPNTQIIFAKNENFGWIIVAIDTVYTQGDIDIWTSTLDIDSSNNIFIKATVGNHGNLCSYLYRYAASKKTFKRIKGYESLPNATFSLNGNLISSLAVSGQYLLSFYQILNDTIYKVDNYKAKALDSIFFNKMRKSINYLNNHENK